MIFIKKYAPIIMIGYSYLYTIISLFIDLSIVYPYLSEMLGYSMFTNIVLWLHYSNKGEAIRTALRGLFVLNVSNIIYIKFDFYDVIYDLLVLSVIASIIIVSIYKNERVDK